MVKAAKLTGLLMLRDTYIKCDKENSNNLLRIDFVLLKKSRYYVPCLCQAARVHQGTSHILLRNVLTHRNTG